MDTSPVTLALDDYFMAKDPPLETGVGLRHELGLTQTVLGYEPGLPGLEKQDGDARARVTARARNVVIRLRSAPGAYRWDRDEDVVGLAADALRFYVLGDMALKAVRTDPKYRETAREYYKQAEEVLEDALSAIADALAGGENPTGGPLPPEANSSAAPPSTSVRARRVW